MLTGLFTITLIKRVIYALSDLATMTISWQQRLNFVENGYLIASCH